MIKRILCARVGYREMSYLISAVIPLSLIFVLLTGGGHAPKVLILPALILFGPLWFLFPQGGIAGLIFAVFAPYPLYFIYGLVFVAVSEHRERARLALIMAIALLHVTSAIGILVYKFQ
jgi:hypothetical protein